MPFSSPQLCRKLKSPSLFMPNLKSSPITIFFMDNLDNTFFMKSSGVMFLSWLLKFRKKEYSTSNALSFLTFSDQGNILGGFFSSVPKASAKNSLACGSVKITIFFQLFFCASFCIFLIMCWCPRCKPSKLPIVAISFSSLCFDRKRSIFCMPLIRYILG